MDPILPNEEHNACMEFLVYVGNNSDVKMYVMPKYDDDKNLPITYKNIDSQGRSVGKRNEVDHQFDSFCLNEGYAILTYSVLNNTV